MPFATTWIDLADIMLSEISQTKTNTVYFHLYVKSKKQNKTTNITKQIVRYREKISSCQRGVWGDRQNRQRGLRCKNYQL